MWCSAKLLSAVSLDIAVGSGCPLMLMSNGRSSSSMFSKSSKTRWPSAKVLSPCTSSCKADHQSRTMHCIIRYCTHHHRTGSACVWHEHLGWVTQKSVAVLLAACAYRAECREVAQQLHHFRRPIIHIANRLFTPSYHSVPRICVHDGQILQVHRHKMLTRQMMPRCPRARQAADL